MSKKITYDQIFMIVIFILGLIICCLAGLNFAIVNRGVVIRK